MQTLPSLLRNGRGRVRNLLGGAAAASAMAVMACGASAADKADADAPAMCMLAGIEIPKAEDKDCPTDVLATLRTYYYEYEAPKLDEDGKPVIDAESGEAVMGVHRETFALMADLLEAAGFSDALKGAPATVFALPDSVLAPVVKVLAEALKDEERREAVAAKLTVAAGSHALNEPIAKSRFRNANGKVWTLAGGWQSAAAPLSFYALSGDGSVTVNGVMLDRTDIMAPDGSVIHTIASPLVALPQPAMEMADKSG